MKANRNDILPFLVLVSATSSSAKDFNRFSQSNTPAYVREVDKWAEKVNANALWTRHVRLRVGQKSVCIGLAIGIHIILDLWIMKIKTFHWHSHHEIKGHDSYSFPVSFGHGNFTSEFAGNPLHQKFWKFRNGGKWY